MSEYDYKEIGRITYFEPSRMSFENNDGLPDDYIAYPYDEYSMAIDLSIEVHNRFSCGFGKETGEVNVFNYSSEKGTISFLGGTKLGEYEGENSGETRDARYLTVNYTDISFQTPEYNTSECLGIETISITYDSWFYPQVSIKFVDVRCGTVMLPSEREYYNPKNEGISKSIYKSLFSFPYPIFTLKVKGFYGRGVTYKLAVSKTSMEFDANTGNCNINVDFIGYMYGIFADIPITFLAVAPYTTVGEQYWAEQKANSNFRFGSKTGVGCEMPTFPELRLKLAQIANNQEILDNNKRTEDEIGRINEQMAALDALSNTDFPFKLGDGWVYDENDPSVTYLATGSLDKVTTLKMEISAYTESLKEYDKGYGTNYSSRFGFGNLLDDSSIVAIRYTKQSSGVPKYQPEEGRHGNNKRMAELYIRKTQDLESKLLRNKNEEAVDIIVVTNRGLITKISGGTTYEDIRLDMEKEKAALNEKILKRQEECNKINNALIEKVLGFKPTIKNIYDLAFAHMDTFTHVFYSYMGAIKEQLNGDRTNRLKSHYNISDGETDTEKMQPITDGTSEVESTERSHYLPPFTAFYKQKNLANSGDGMTLRWAGELVNSPDLIEVGFTKEMLAAAKLYFEDAVNIEKKIQEMAQRPDLNIGDLTVDVEHFIPITTYDFVHHTGGWNPYDHLKSKVRADAESIEGDVIFTFVLRAFYYFATHQNYDDVSGKGFGVIEALNFFKAVGDSVSGNFLRFLKGFAGERKKSIMNAFLNCVANACGSVTSQSNTNVSDTWKGLGNSTILSKSADVANTNSVGGALLGEEIVDSVNTSQGSYYYNLYSVGDDGLSYLPIGVFDPITIRQCFALPETLVTDDRFLLTRKYAENYNYNGGDFFIGKTMNRGTFTVIEDGKYLTSLLESIKNEIEVSEGKLAQRNGENTSRRGDEYGEVYKSTNMLEEFESSNNDKDDDAIYRKYAIVDDNGDSESRSTLRGIVRGDKETQQHYWIKYPGMVDDDKDKCIFDFDFYRCQTDKYAKAYVFLLSMPILGKRGGRQGGIGIDSKSENGVVMKSLLLREGALYWYDEFGYDIISTCGGTYKKCSKGYFYDGDNYSDTFDTICPAKSNSSRTYLTWDVPTNSSISRRIYLMNYFKYWTDNYFEPNRHYLEDSRMYEDGDFSKGLNTLAGSQPEANPIKSQMIDLQAFLRNLFFTECTIFDYYNGSNIGYTYYRRSAPSDIEHATSTGNMKCTQKQMYNAIDSFLEQLRYIYGQTVEELEDNPTEFYKRIKDADREDPFKNDDLRLSTYMTLKSLYDKWLCAPYHGIKTWKLHRNNSSGTGESGQTTGTTTESAKEYPSDFDNFFYIDNYYHDISQDLNVNVSRVSEWLTSCLPVTEIQDTEGIMGYFNKTLYEYLAEIAQDSTGGQGMLLALPQRFGLMSGATADMFRPIPVCDDWDEDTSSFVFIYNYRPSEKLGDKDTNMDMNGWSPDGDGFDLTDDEIVGNIMGGEGYKIPAFGVTYAKQNQSYFKNITLNSEVQGTTEVGLRATFDIAAKASQQPRESTLYGQDLYKVYANYAYECTVESLGNMQIFPLMYFQLNNVPLWRGAYMIKKVSHNIAAGNITTTFTGIRQNRYAIPFADASVTINRTEPVPDNGSNGGGSNGGGVGDTYVGSSSVDTSGISGSENNVGPNPNTPLPNGTDTSDINESNITEEKPLICITPAHGPRTGKSLEWAWSTKLIDQYLIPKLKLKKYSDGTPYNIHRCNVNGNNTSAKGYSMAETRALVKKYGSKRVISVVPHWNGGGSYYHVVMINKASNGSRRDSKILAEMLREESLKMINKGVNGEFRQMPDGFMRNKNIKPVMPLGENNTDGAPQQDCACVLTENWFADYSVNGVSYTGSSYNTLDSEGRYQTGRAWLESNEGCNVVADYHVAGIVNYINSLKGGGSSGGGYGTPPPANYTYAANPNKTNRGLVEYCQRQAQCHRPYWWGCYGEMANQELYDKKKRMFGSVYDRTDPPYNQQYGAKAHDCCGLIKGYMWSDNPDDPNPKYGSNGFKDATSDGMLRRATRKGPISTIPEVPGIAVYMDGHVGVYIGNGRVIEAKGHAYGVVNTALAGRGWTDWAYIDEITYLDSPQ